MVVRWEADAELEALRTLAVRVWDLVPDNTVRPSSLAASLSMVLELLDGRINTVATNGVRSWTRSVLVAALSHFLELNSMLVLLESGRNVNLTEDQVDAL
jgi:hypothetical protein